MRTLKYLFMFILSATLINSCWDDTMEIDLNDDGPNIVTFERVVDNLGAEANGEEFDFRVRIRLVGPSSMDLTNDIEVTFVRNDASTAVEGEHYRINNLPITLSKSDNYLGFMDITLITEGNSPPLEGTPEFDAWVPPVLELDIVASGDPSVVGSGKGGNFTLNFRAPNPYAGLYDAHIIYRHPSLGEYPDNISVDEVNEKELIAVTGRKCETGFAVWFDTDICWITVNPDNSINFVVDDTWDYDVKLGDPFDPSLVSHFDPDTRQIYLYYHYEGDGGFRVFWEVFTPKF